jgi:glucose/arabinose dehydrogenase
MKDRAGRRLIDKYRTISLTFPIPSSSPSAAKDILFDRGSNSAGIGSRRTKMSRASPLCTLLISLILVQAARAQLLPAVSPGSVHVDLQPIAAGLTSPIDMAVPGDGTNRLFVTDQIGRVNVIQNGVLQSPPFLDISSRLVSLSPGYDERGLLGLAFDPNFAANRTIYTFTSEPVSGGGTFPTVPMPSGTPFNCQSVLAAWTVSASNPNQVDPASRRELFRIDKPQSNHNGGEISFGADGYLYIATGDGGNANDSGNGHDAALGNAQLLSNPLGKILRIDVHGSNSSNGQYGIPATNPFAGSPGAVKEIFAYGFRNPYRFSFDRSTGELIAADVGQNNVEEVDRVVSGGNYGWRYKEGTFKFNPANGSVSTDLSGLPAGLLDPAAEYDHTQGIATVGGFVYRGSLLPDLVGKYVFGDFSRGFGSPTGRLFYANLDTGLIQELLVDPGSPFSSTQGRYLKGFGEDANGELYVLASTNLGPSGTSGVVYALVPEPSTLLMLASPLAFGIWILMSGKAKRKNA